MHLFIFSSSNYSLTTQNILLKEFEREKLFFIIQYSFMFVRELSFIEILVMPLDSK